MTELRPRHPYIGKPRFKQVEGRLEPVDQRAFTAPPSAIIWTMTLQAQAVERGFFLERHYVGDNPHVRLMFDSDNHARVIPIFVGHGQHTDLDIVRGLEQKAAHGDAFSVTALAFIEQQDRYGYSGAWDKRVERYTVKLTWFKQLKAAQRARNFVSRSLHRNPR